MTELYPSAEQLNSLSGTNDVGQEVLYDPYTDLYKTLYRLLDVARRAGDLRVYKDGDLTFGVRPGAFMDGATAVTYAGAADQPLSDEDTNYIYLTTDGQLHVNQTGFPSASTTPHVPLASITTTNGIYNHSDITDYRGRSMFHMVNGLSSAKANILQNLTATAADLNKLDGTNQPNKAVVLDEDGLLPTSTIPTNIDVRIVHGETDAAIAAAVLDPGRQAISTSGRLYVGKENLPSGLPGGKWEVGRWVGRQNIELHNFFDPQQLTSERLAAYYPYHVFSNLATPDAGMVGNLTGGNNANMQFAVRPAPFIINNNTSHTLLASWPLSVPTNFIDHTCKLYIRGFAMNMVPEYMTSASIRPRLYQAAYPAIYAANETNKTILSLSSADVTPPDAAISLIISGNPSNRLARRTTLPWDVTTILWDVPQMEAGRPLILDLEFAMQRGSENANVVYYINDMWLEYA
jgi:hypothetical protein